MSVETFTETCYKVDLEGDKGGMIQQDPSPGFPFQGSFGTRSNFLLELRYPQQLAVVLLHLAVGNEMLQDRRRIKCRLLTITTIDKQSVWLLFLDVKHRVRPGTIIRTTPWFLSSTKQTVFL